MILLPEIMQSFNVTYTTFDAMNNYQDRNKISEYDMNQHHTCINNNMT